MKTRQLWMAAFCAAGWMCMPQANGASMRGPHDSPSLEAGATALSPAYTSQLCRLGFRVYQKGFSICINSDCPMTPSCSNYAKDAVHRHGALLGTLLTADRLLHEKTEVSRVPKIWIPAQGWRSLDPVTRHTRWWSPHSSASR